MQELRANTAVDVLIGPFLDSTDGITAETELTIAQADVRLSKNGQNIAQKNDNTSCVHDELGYYNCELDATDTNTLGTLVLAVAETGALPVRHEYMVLSEEAWDAKYLGEYGVVDAGTAQAGAAGTITLATSASTTADYYNGMTVYVRAGTGAGQSRVIHDYSTGRVASVSPNWSTNPSTDSEYVLYPTAPANQSEPVEVNVTEINGTAVSTTNAQLGVNVVEISEDATAADNLEAAYDGTGYDIGGIDVSELNQIVDDWINAGRLDVILDAIRAKTDDLTFTVANQVDANVQYINDAAVTGDGSATPWDGA